MRRRDLFFNRISDWTQESVPFGEATSDSDALVRVMIGEVLGHPIRVTDRAAREFLDRFRAWRALHPNVGVEIPAELP